MRCTGRPGADLVCHQDTWGFLVEQAAGSPHFRVPGETVPGPNGEIRVTLSGRSLIAVLTALHDTLEQGHEPDTGTWALAGRLYERIAQVVEGVTTCHRVQGRYEVPAGIEGRAVIVIDDRLPQAEVPRSSGAPGDAARPGSSP